MLNRWNAHFGSDQARKIARAGLNEPGAYIRVPKGSDLPLGLEVEGTEIEGCFRLHSPLRPGMRLHDISSQAILPLLDLQPGHTYLDLCAAPGNKTLQALETALRLAVSCDISLKRIREIPPVCPRVVLDAGCPLPFREPFDRVFIDAPCSGTGTLARNPEIKWRVQERDFEKFGELQTRIVSEGLRVLARGGKLLYATCSLEGEENEEVIGRVLHRWPEFHCEREMWRLPGREQGDGFYAAVLVRRLAAAG
jgi:16S rRNA (cytosine967-C5)-methyltransferase